jgi:rhamnose transport system ATP-binding protein
MRRHARELLDDVGSSIPEGRLVRGLSVAEMQLVEIAHALSQSARVVIVDEPTASLTPVEVQSLFEILRGLRDRGVAVLFIGHRLEEVFDIADRLTVLRDGSVVGTGVRGEFTEDQLIQLMVGRQAKAIYERAGSSASTEPALVVDGLSRSGVFKDISLTVHVGEVVGLAGLVGAGRSEVARCIFGIDHYDVGTVTICGERLPGTDPIASVRSGLAYVPEDRKAEGLATSLSVGDNISILLLRQLTRFGLVRRAAENDVTLRLATRLGVKTQGTSQVVGQLSGGNQQKVVIARWLATNPKVLILDEPTRGVDVGAKEEIHGLIHDLAAEGLAILLISSDLPEVLALSDRVGVIREGRLVGWASGTSATAERVMSLAASAIAQGQTPTTGELP